MVIATLVALALIAQIFGLTMQVCKNAGGYSDYECFRYNVVIALLIKLKNILNDISPLVTAIATGVIAWFTFSLRDATAEQGHLSKQSGEHFQVTERAYVRMSHVSSMRSGVVWKEGKSGEFSTLIEVKNYGRTPARVTAVWLTCKAVPKREEFSVDFSYGDGDLSYDSGHGYTFLMPTDTFYVPQEPSINPEEYIAVEDRNEAILIVFGYVDYIDQFGEHHRAGYGRQYVPRTSGNNLIFPNVKAKLNYDEIRKPGIGWDWHQEQ